MLASSFSFSPAKLYRRQQPATTTYYERHIDVNTCYYDTNSKTNKHIQNTHSNNTVLLSSRPQNLVCFELGGTVVLQYTTLQLRLISFEYNNKQAQYNNNHAVLLLARRPPAAAAAVS